MSIQTSTLTSCAQRHTRATRKVRTHTPHCTGVILTPPPLLHSCGLKEKFIRRHFVTKKIGGVWGVDRL